MKERPSNQIMLWVEKERHLAAQELELLEQSAAIETTARATKRELDEVRGALRALAGTPAHAEAEALFLELAAANLPAHVATLETAQALDQRKKAATARSKALLAEAAVIAARREHVAGLAAAIAMAREKAAGMAARFPVEATHPAPPTANESPPTNAAPADQEPTDATASTTTLADAPPDNSHAPGRAWVKPRVHKRVEIERRVTLTSEAGTFVGFCRNLSVGGMLLTTYDKLLPAGTPVEVMLMLSGRPLQIPATVRYATKSGDAIGMGIDFGNTSPEIQVALYAFLNELGAEFWEHEE